VAEPTHTDNVERNLGEQPLAGILAQLNLSPHDLVAKSDGHVTHKMVARACKGRRLTRKSQVLVRDALNAAAETAYAVADLFNYAGL
jgi:hypothetical protein